MAAGTAGPGQAVQSLGTRPGRFDCRTSPVPHKGERASRDAVADEPVCMQM